MTILQIGVLAVLALIAGRLPKGRQLLMLGISTFAIFWLQPPEPSAHLLFWLPFATLGIAILGWALTSTPEGRDWQENWPAAVVLVAVVLIVDLNRYFRFEVIYTAVTPSLQAVLGIILGIAAVAWLLTGWSKALPVWRFVALFAIILVFVFLKSPVLARTAVGYLASLRRPDQVDRNIAISWLGFSYVAFRLLHTIRDRQSGRLPAVTLTEYMNYVIFFPAFTAGPIDRVERFIGDLRQPQSLADEDLINAGTRLFLGVFKKFVIADLLAVISISDVMVSRIQTAGWMWVFLYAYAFQIYFDFSGYTDVAIGMGRLMRVRLPENFTLPYLKPNLTQFWNSWHITLTQWFRSYFFNPLTRSVRSAEHPWPLWSILLTVQTGTMVLIGLWHGITWGYAAWGLWHGLGLFVQNRWSCFIRNRIPGWATSPRGQFAMNALGAFLTFNYVALGWLFFTLSSPNVALQAMRKLFGLA